MLTPKRDRYAIETFFADTLASLDPFDRRDGYAGE
jgi:hypothetical protein